MPRPKTVSRTLGLVLKCQHYRHSSKGTTDMTYCSPMKNKRPVKLYTKSQANNHTKVFNTKEAPYTNKPYRGAGIPTFHGTETQEVKGSKSRCNH